MEKETPSQESLFIIIKDRSNFEHKVINFDNNAICPRKGKREISSIKKSSRHVSTSSFTNIKDKETGIIYGIPQGIDQKTGELKFRRIIIEDHMFFDLSIESERKMFIVLSNAPFVADSPFGQGKPRFRIVNREKEAEKIIFIQKNKRVAEDIISELTTVEMFDLGRNLGLPVDQMSDSMVQAELYEYVSRKPKPGLGEKSGAEDFLEMYHNSNREVITVLKRAMSVGAVKFELASGFVTSKGIPLGINESQAVRYLLSNTSLLLALDQESKEKDRHTKEYSTDADFKKNVLDHINKTQGNTSFMNEKVIDKTMEELHERNKQISVELAEREKRLNEKEEKFDRMMQMMEEKLKSSDVPPVVSADSGPDYEHALLISKAKELGIKSPHLYGKEVLKKKIEEEVNNFSIGK